MIECVGLDEKQIEDKKLSILFDNINNKISQKDNDIFLSETKHDVLDGLITNNVLIEVSNDQDENKMEIIKSIDDVVQDNCNLVTDKKTIPNDKTLNLNLQNENDCINAGVNNYIKVDENVESLLQECNKNISEQININNIQEENQVDVTDTTKDCQILIESKDPVYEKLYYQWTLSKLVCKTSEEEFIPTDTCENFTKGCHWSPDGTCILVPSEDYKIKIFELPRVLYSGVLPEDFREINLKSSLKVKEGGTVYDTCWFPYMNSWDPTTCCFLSTSQGSPVHLWDAFTGKLRATYRAYNL